MLNKPEASLYIGHVVHIVFDSNLYLLLLRQGVLELTYLKSCRTQVASGEYGSRTAWYLSAASTASPRCPFV